MKAILLPGNSLKFPLVKVIVSKIAYKSLKTTKNSLFLRTNHRNVVHENFFRGLGDIICIKNLFKLIRVINRTNSWAIWTRISEDIDHFSKRPATPPLKKKNSHFVPILLCNQEIFLKQYLQPPLRQKKWIRLDEKIHSTFFVKQKDENAPILTGRSHELQWSPDVIGHK